MTEYLRKADPASTPPNTSAFIGFSDALLAVCPATAGGQMSVYWRSTLAKFANNPAVGFETCYGVAIHPDNELMVIGRSNNARVFRINLGDESFTQLANLPSSPGTTIYNPVFSQDGTLLVVGGSSFPEFAAYTVDAETETFTRVPNPAVGVPNQVRDIAISPDGTLVAIAHNNSPFVSVYQFNGSTLTKLANPASLPPNIVFSVSFSADGQYLACAGISTAPRFTLYEIDGTTLTKVEGTPSYGANLYTTRFSPVDQTIVVFGVGMSTPLLYDFADGVMSNERSLPGDAAASAFSGSGGFSNDGELFGYGSNTLPYIALWERESTETAKALMGETPLTAIRVGSSARSAAYMGGSRVL